MLAVSCVQPIATYCKECNLLQNTISFLENRVVPAFSNKTDLLLKLTYFSMYQMEIPVGRCMMDMSSRLKCTCGYAAVAFASWH